MWWDRVTSNHMRRSIVTFDNSRIPVLSFLTRMSGKIFYYPDPGGLYPERFNTSVITMITYTYKHYSIIEQRAADDVVIALVYVKIKNVIYVYSYVQSSILIYTRLILPSTMAFHLTPSLTFHTPRRDRLYCYCWY